MADAEQGLVGADANAEAPTYGSADTSATEKPPPFDEVPGDEPPSYSSVMQELKDAKKTSSGTLDFITKILTILINTIAFTILMAVILIVPIAMVVMGAVHIDDCPVQRLIPIFLIVSGSVYIVKTILDLAVRYRRRKEGGAAESSYLRENSVSRLFACILLVFFILGNVWVYANFRPDDDPTSPRYCYPPLYYFAFWIITLAYIFFIVSCCCACCTITLLGISLAT
ncbi:transmembrane protein 272-like [Patiria miniata]|uniref:Uncharacterized protein n=1 Tax=Patiria miniata TaxID=46514 RepID=A0A913ZY09_PATMI|nr:transmembrane protein 272-like [Patiria miniata]